MRAETRSDEISEECRDWLDARLAALTCEITTVSPSALVESKRWMPPSVTETPGFYSFSRSPYARSILDCLDIHSPVREVVWMKGAQIGASTTLENALFYAIDAVRNAPCLWYTADDTIAATRVKINITPMLQQSGLSDSVRSIDEGNAKKTGRTANQIEWVGGGSVRFRGAQSANNFRDASARFVYADEVDGWKHTVGRDGDPIALTRSRTSAYEASRKIFWVSTPTIEGLSKIKKLFLRGDQRYLFVPCLACGHKQILRWRHKENPENGVIGGISWETDEDGHVVPGSVRYLCEKCGHEHRNEEKTRMLDESIAEWRPTAKPEHPSIVSFHTSALYSLQQSWEEQVRMWIQAWDVKANRVRDMNALQVFYNNVLGETFELQGERVRFEHVSSHKRSAYRLGEVPNRFAEQSTGGKIGVLVAAADIHKEFIRLGIFGWARGLRPFLIDYEHLEGDASNLEDPGTWGALSEIIEGRVYVADDGSRYNIPLTLVDSGYEQDLVQRFTQQYERGVVAVKGGDCGAKMFRPSSTALGEPFFLISVDRYKDRWGTQLRRGWDGLGMMPEGHFSAPHDIPDRYLKELTTETKVVEFDPVTREARGWKWHRPSGARNELWDTLIYSSAGLEILAWEHAQATKHKTGTDQVLWPMFWDHCERGAFRV